MEQGLKTTPSRKVFAGKATGKQKQARRFSGNGLSRTAMLFKIALAAGHRLTVVEMNKIKDMNPRRLEQVYDEVLRIGDAGNAMFALRLLLG